MTQAMEKAAPKVSNLAQVTGFDDRIIQLVRQTVCPGATPLELAVFLYNAKRLGLDPMTKQIYWIKYNRDQAGEIVIGINGYRSQAESSGVYAGSDPPEFEYEPCGRPNDGTPAGAPSKATVTVYKIVAGQRVPFTAEARWDEFYPGAGKQGEQYRKRPHNQLAVRAESHALRKGFPQVMERMDIQAAPTSWEQAALADESARHDPAKQARDDAEYGRVFDVYDDGPTRVKRQPAPKPKSAPAPEPEEEEIDPGDMGEGGWAEAEERAAAQDIIERAHAAAEQRDADVDQIEHQRQQRLEGVK